MSADPDAFLHAFHARHPGVTVNLMARGTSPQGSSYEILANEVPQAAPGLTVLDLGCGSGYLLELLQRREQPGLQLIGADMSAEELALARQRLGTDVSFLHEPAQRLSLPTASVDVVLCHMALMLMAPLEPVVAELRRVLRPQGLFSAVVNAYSQTPTPVVRTFGGLLHETIQQGGPVPPDLGDARMHNQDGIKAVFSPENGFDQLTLEEVPVQLSGTLEQVADFFGSSYNVFALGDRRGEFMRRLHAGLEPLQEADGQVPFAMTTLKLRCRRI